MPARFKSSGFAIISIIVAMAMSILVVVTIANLANSPAKQAKTLDAQRQSALLQIQHALDEYAGNHNGQYPATTVSTNFVQYDSHQPQCYQCGLTQYQQSGVTDVPFTKDDWIPELVNQGYLATLPVDPQTGQQHAGLCQATSWPRGYIYISNGQDYKLNAFCTPTTGLNLGVGATSPYCVDTDQHLLPNPANQSPLNSLIDPKQPSFHYAIYSPGWACK